MTGRCTGCRAAVRRRVADDAGAGSVLVVALLAALALAATAALVLGQAVVARHRAGTAADLAALAGAGAAWPVSATGPCAGPVREAAWSLARSNGGTVLTCRVGDGGVVDVEVAVAVPGWASGVGPARASARAGPAP